MKTDHTLSDFEKWARERGHYSAIRMVGNFRKYQQAIREKRLQQEYEKRARNDS